MRLPISPCYQIGRSMPLRIPKRYAACSLASITFPCCSGPASILPMPQVTIPSAPALFRASIPLPAEVPVGTYEVDVRLFADGVQIARTPAPFEVYKSGFEQVVTAAARDHGVLYGLATAIMAIATGWFASVVFRRD